MGHKNIRKQARIHVGEDNSMYLYGKLTPNKYRFRSQKLKQRKKSLYLLRNKWYILNASFGKKVLPLGRSVG